MIEYTPGTEPGSHDDCESYKEDVKRSQGQHATTPAIRIPIGCISTVSATFVPSGASNRLSDTTNYFDLKV
jgi:hypothetical protein